MSSVEIKVMDLPEVKQFCDETEKAIAELTARAEKAEHERDAQHKLVAAEENNRKAICIYCGHVGQKEDVPAHIDECLKHPLSWKNDPQGYALEQVAELQAELKVGQS